MVPFEGVAAAAAAPFATAADDGVDEGSGFLAFGAGVAPAAPTDPSEAFGAGVVDLGELTTVGDDDPVADVPCLCIGDATIIDLAAPASRVPASLIARRVSGFSLCQALKGILTSFRG